MIYSIVPQIFKFNFVKILSSYPLQNIRNLILNLEYKSRVYNNVIRIIAENLWVSKTEKNFNISKNLRMIPPFSTSMNSMSLSIKKIYRYIFFIFIILLKFIGCSNSGENLQNGSYQNEAKILTILSLYRDTGECLHIQSEETKINYICSKYNRGFCSINLLITTNGEKNKILSDVGSLLNKRTECTDSAGLSGLLGQNTTSLEDERKIRSANQFLGVDSCYTSEQSNYDKLVSLPELRFLRTPRGKIGKEAEKIRSTFLFTQTQKKNAENCLINEFSESERSLISDIIAKRKYEEVFYSVSK